jgi:endonuclease/exonuclease/phosphatase family metal-dependent hydrolase
VKREAKLMRESWQSDWRAGALAALLWLFWLQAARVLFSVLFGVIYDALFDEQLSWQTLVGGGLLLPVFLLPLIVPRDHLGRWAAWGAAVAGLARVPLTLNDAGVRLIAGLLVVAGAGLYLADALGRGRKLTIIGLVAALCADQILRALGHSLDLSLYPAWLPVQAALALVVLWLVWRGRGAQTAAAGVPWGDGLALGALLFLELNLLAVPAALAGRAELGGAWERIGVWLAPLLLALTMLPWLPGAAPLRTSILERRGWRGLLPAIVLVTLIFEGHGVGTLLLYLLAQFLLLICLAGAAEPGPQPVRPGGAWALAGITFLLGNFALAFALTYPYALPFMRGTGNMILAAAGVLATLPGLSRRYVQARSAEPGLRTAWAAAALALLLTIYGSWPARVSPPPVGPVHAATYNIHYGYDTDWHLSLEGQAQAIAAAGADVVLLQEVDVGRITAYSADDTAWLARRLGMHAVYAPTVEGLTGIGLLSRYPIREIAIELLPSDLEQTAIIRATLDLGNGRLADAYATWLGLTAEERAQQLTAALAFMQKSDRPALFGGDLNSTPDSPTYTTLIRTGWADSVAAGGFPELLTDPAINPTKRIDYVWWRGPWQVTGAAVPDSLASDHRLFVATATLP